MFRKFRQIQKFEMKPYIGDFQNSRNSRNSGTQKCAFCRIGRV
jgi:hypothetical protein